MNLNTLILAAITLLISACIDTSTEQDRAFLLKIKEHLVNKGDVVRVSDIHPGNWQEVCFTSAGTRDTVFSKIEKIHNVARENIVVRNRSRNEVGHTDMFDWGVYFFYPPNEIEYYRISNGDTWPNQHDAITNGNFKCANHADAHFKAMRDQKPKNTKEFSLVIQVTQIIEKN